MTEYEGLKEAALATMGYKHRPLPHDQALAAPASPGFLLKTIGAQRNSL